ncbi:HAMP domain-containing sensor histidine kinase [Actinomycetaceae bacterium MB13-C1-2]|nr:HAMP domain-containing sensor histidine kinase [Actinomycetaceae bacterium MB13-C1-2]
MHILSSLREQFGRLPLSKRMVLILVIILSAALLIAGTLMIGILQRHLVDQIDRQLESSAEQLANQLSDYERPSGQSVFPTDYYIRIDSIGYLGGGGEVLSQITEARAGRPTIDVSTEYLEQVHLLGAATHPVTVSSSVPGATWRAISIPFDMSGNIAGVITLALPLVGVTETLATTAFSFLLASAVLVGTAWIVGHYLVRRSLQPLSDIETVAGAIAAGDLSKRIPNAPLSTEVGSLSASLNSMLVQIERSFAASEVSEQKTRRFVSDASHELRTPLAAIRGYAELYQMGGVSDDEIADVMTRIQAESTRMGTLVEDLLTLARLDEKPALRLEALDLVEMTKQVKSDLHAMDPKRTIRLVASHGQRIPSSLVVQADSGQITQVFLNLAGNINRYTPPGSPVEIALGTTPGRALVEFRDHGPGIPQEDRGRVFERFYRTGKSRSRELGGSGLGLSIVDSIVEAHGGEVSLWETDPHGLTVRVVLPISGPEQAEPGI